ncbi:MAG: phosphoribosyl-AMP cyclohydrolase [Spirochaetota bacterium]
MSWQQGGDERPDGLFEPQFNSQGLIPVFVTDYESGEALMQAWMNREALERTLHTGVAHYYSRSRSRLWKKGESSGNVQKVRDVLIDCDQDSLWLRVDQLGGAACHTGFRSCFYRRVVTDASGSLGLEARLQQRVFDPDKVYGREQP